MNGNISKEGIKLDLEWMHRVGLGGFQNFDAALSTPQVVDHRLAKGRSLLHSARQLEGKTLREILEMNRLEERRHASAVTARAGPRRRTRRAAPP